MIQKNSTNRMFEEMRKAALQRLNGRTARDISDKTGIFFDEEKPDRGRGSECLQKNGGRTDSIQRRYLCGVSVSAPLPGHIENLVCR